MSTSITTTGNLTADPEIRFTPNGHCVANFRVLANRREQNQSGEWVDAEPSAWNVEAWGSLAEHLGDSLSKGDPVIVTGTLRTEAWADRETGEKRTRMILRADAIGHDLNRGTTSFARSSKRPNTGQDAGQESAQHEPATA